MDIYESIKKHLQSYPNHVPATLHNLDELRFSDIPATLAKRKSDGDAYLEKSEVVSLVQWKLKHGIFRPKLAALVASNSDQEITSTTKSAFTIYEADNAAHAKAIKTLTELKGIGPATASLLLSCYDPTKVPFFSDELFRFSLWEPKSGCGWDRKIKYNMKEYKEMFEQLEDLRIRLEKDSAKLVSAMDLERVAYVLGKEGLSSSEWNGTGAREGGEVDEAKAGLALDGKRKMRSVPLSGEKSISRAEPGTKKRRKR